ncbi:TRAP transporter substrate-binding protein [Propylenella binzhouense]|nr:TRAP transporter substrate-binding protein [Propylenella binzhouense]
MLSKRAVLAAMFAVATAAIGRPALAQSTVLIGNATANDTQAAVNDKFAELITKYSDGRLSASARHGQSLGTNVQMIAALQAGSLQGMVFPAGFLSSAVPELALFDMPFLLPGEPAKITAFAKQSKAAEQMKEAAEKKGVHIIGFHGIGPQHLLTKFPVNTVADLKGKKFRVIPSPPRVGAYQDWGVVTRPMELGEVYTALQQGAIDGFADPPDVLFKMKHFEVADHYTITNQFAFVSNVIVSKRWFDGLPKDLQDAVTKAGTDAIAWADEAYTKAQVSSLQALEGKIEVSEMPPAELQKMKDMAKAGVWARLAEDKRLGPTVEILKEDVERFNKGT